MTTLECANKGRTSVSDQSDAKKGKMQQCLARIEEEAGEDKVTMLWRASVLRPTTLGAWFDGPFQGKRKASVSTRSVDGLIIWTPHSVPFLADMLFSGRRHSYFLPTLEYVCFRPRGSHESHNFTA
jgi:hypothetical protein